MVVSVAHSTSALLVSIEKRLVPAARLVLLAVALALDLVPVDQLDRRRHHAHELRPLDRLEALAAARRHVVLAAAELHRLAARRLQRELVEAARPQRPA